jgi:hypothetical protein
MKGNAVGIPSSRRLRGRREKAEVRRAGSREPETSLADGQGSEATVVKRRRGVFAWLQHRYTSDRLESLADRLERAAEVSALSKPQSEANRNNAEAIARLLEAARDTPYFVAISESVLVIKTTDSRGPRVLAKTLTATELRMFEEHRIPLADPMRALDILSTGDGSEPSGPPE